ncbi:hypothetical protein LXL04_023537 [Taraxacum kok-saghyz]
MSSGVEIWLGKTLQKLDSLLLGFCRDFKETNFVTVVDAYALIGDVSGLAEKIQRFFMQEVIHESHAVLNNMVLEAYIYSNSKVPLGHLSPTMPKKHDTNSFDSTPKGDDGNGITESRDDGSGASRIFGKLQQVDCSIFYEETQSKRTFVQHWKEMTENLLRAKQVWNLIDPGIREPVVRIAQSEAEKKKLEELRMKNLQVKHYLYHALDRVTFEQILDRKTSKAVWDSTEKRFAENARVKKSMLQKLRRDIEIIEMKTGETIPEYFGRVLTISNQMRSNGEEMTDVKIVEKILRTLTEKYVYVVVSIEESKNIEEMSIEELQSTLVVHEQKFKKNEREEEQALKIDTSGSFNTRGRGRGRSNSRGRGRGCGRHSFNKETVECYNCHKLGHYSYECPDAKEANYVGFDENEEIMLMTEVNGFMAQADGKGKSMLWFLDSGCSNHICGNKERSIELDQSFTNTVKLGNNTRMEVEGKGSVKLILNKTTYVIKEVYFVQELKNNLLSIGQLQQKGLSFLFQFDICKAYHPDKGLVFQCYMRTNRMFSLNEDANEAIDQRTDECLYTSEDDIARLWHERLGHLSKTGMKTLQHKGMVRDLPNFVVDTTVCGDYIMGKQIKEIIPKSSTWWDEDVLDLVHSDICGPITPASQTGKRYFMSFIDDYSQSFTAGYLRLYEF